MNDANDEMATSHAKHMQRVIDDIKQRQSQDDTEPEMVEVERARFERLQAVVSAAQAHEQATEWTRPLDTAATHTSAPRDLRWVDLGDGTCAIEDHGIDDFRVALNALQPCDLDPLP